MAELWLSLSLAIMAPACVGKQSALSLIVWNDQEKPTHRPEDEHNYVV